MQSRPSTVVLRALLLALVLAFAFTATAAAKESHVFEKTFGTGELTLSENAGVAVNSTSHDVYVADGTKVAQFKADGTPIRTFGSLTSASFLAVDNSGGASNGSVYVTSGSNSVVKFAANGTLESGWGTGGTLSGLGQVGGIAVGAAGNLYVFDVGSGQVSPFTAAGVPQPTTQAPRGNKAAGFVVDSENHYYKVDAAPEVTKFDVSGATLVNSVTQNGNANAINIDAANGDLYVAESTPPTISEYGLNCGESCAPKDSFGQGDVGSAGGVAVDSSTKAVFVTDVANNRVAAFTAPVTIPDAFLKPTTAISRSGATLNGEVGAAGASPAECEFQYVKASNFFSEGFKNAEIVPCNPSGPFSGSTLQEVSAAVTGLTVETEYMARVVATSANGTNATAPESFRTKSGLTLEIAGATEVEAHAANLNATITPEGFAIEECVFEYGTEFKFQKTIPCAESSGEIGTGSSPVPVHAHISGLNPATEYQFQMRAKNSFGPRTSSIAGFLTPGPRIFSVNAKPAETSAILNGSIVPGEEETSYFFEYVSQAEFENSEYAGAAVQPAGGRPIGEGFEAVEVEQEISGLETNTKYHFRLVAVGSDITNVGNDLTFRTFPPSPSGLPDGRVYEQATPASPFEKNGNNLLGDEYNMLKSSPNGEATTFYAVSGAAETESSVVYPTYVARRGTDNWSSEGISPPATLGPRARALAYTRNLSGAYTVSWSAGKPGSVSFVLRDQGGKLYTIFNGQNEVTSDEHERSIAEETTYTTETPDGNEVLIETPAALTGNAVEGDWNVYLWNKSTGETTLVDLLEGGAPPAGGAYAGPWDYNFRFGSRGGALAGYYAESALSNDGSRFFFTTASSPHKIYMRENPASPSGKTTLISASQKTNGPGPDPRGAFSADFLEATPDGSVVFFKSHEELTNDAQISEEEEDEDLYSYDVASGELTDLTAASGAEEARVQGLLGTSTDGSYVYFAARGALAPGAVGGKSNVYVWHEGQIQFITNLTEEDRYAWFNTKLSGSNVWPQKGSRVTPNGKVIAFTSGLNRPEFMSNGWKEIYRWEFGGAGLQCLSCIPTESPAKHSAFFQHANEYFVAPSFETSIASRNLSTNGKRVVFATAEPLVSSDKNGVEDVYEWEAKGEGSCTSSERNGGCIFLISTGTSPDPSFYSDMSEDGSNVFFFTTQRLVGQDKDELSDVYDARIGGGLAAQNAEPPRPCEGEACLDAGTAASPVQARGTTTFSGSGNEKPKTKKKHKKKHHKKKQHKKHKKGKKGHQRQSGGHR